MKAKLFIDGRELTISAEDAIVFRLEDGISVRVDKHDIFEMRYFYPDGNGSVLVSKGEASGYSFPYLSTNHDFSNTIERR